MDENNPFYLLNRYLKDFPNQTLGRENLTCSFINSILSNINTGFELSFSDFDFIMKIKPVKLELPVDSKSLIEVVGKYTGGIELGKGGAYKFTNLNNGFCYVGSYVSLANRLFTGYLGPK